MSFVYKDDGKWPRTLMSVRSRSRDARNSREEVESFEPNRFDRGTDDMLNDTLNDGDAPSKGKGSKRPPGDVRAVAGERSMRTGGDEADSFASG